MRGLTATVLVVLFASSAYGVPPDSLPSPPKDVNIENQPVEITGEVDARVVTGEPLQVRLGGSLYGPGNSFWRGESDPVPTDKRWVVEFLSLSYAVTSTTRSSVGSCTIVIREGVECDAAGPEGIVMVHAIPTTAGQDNFTNGLNISAALPVKIYVEQGQRMCVSCPLPGDNTVVSSGSLNVTGILEPVN